MWLSQQQLSCRQVWRRSRQGMYHTAQPHTNSPRPSPPPPSPLLPPWPPLSSLCPHASLVRSKALMFRAHLCHASACKAQRSQSCWTALTATMECSLSVGWGSSFDAGVFPVCRYTALHQQKQSMQEQVRVKQGECEQLEYRHACTVRYYNTTLHSIEASAAEQVAHVSFI